MACKGFLLCDPAMRKQAVVLATSSPLVNGIDKRAENKGKRPHTDTVRDLEDKTPVETALFSAEWPKQRQKRSMSMKY